MEFYLLTVVGCELMLIVFLVYLIVLIGTETDERHLKLLKIIIKETLVFMLATPLWIFWVPPLLVAGALVLIYKFCLGLTKLWK